MTLVDGARFRSVLGRYPTGVSVITSREADGTPLSMVVGTFTAVSLRPPLVGFLPDHGSTSWPRIRATGRFAVSVLAADQQDHCRLIVAKHPDRFDLLDWTDSPTVNPLLVGAAAWIDCAIESVHPAGDRTGPRRGAGRPPRLALDLRGQSPARGRGGRVRPGVRRAPPRCGPGRCAPGRLDVTGLVLAAAGLVALTVGQDAGPRAGWRDQAAWSGLGAGAVLLGALLRHQLVTPAPLIALRLFADRAFRLGSLVTLLQSAAFAGALYSVALYLQDGLGIAPLPAGLVMC